MKADCVVHYPVPGDRTRNSVQVGWTGLIKGFFLRSVYLVKGTDRLRNSTRFLGFRLKSHDRFRLLRLRCIFGIIGRIPTD